MTFRSTALLFTTLALNVALGCFAAPTIIAQNIEARGIIGDQIKTRELPEHRLVRRRLGIEPRSEHHHRRDLSRSDMVLTTHMNINAPIGNILFVLVHGKHRHWKHCPLRGGHRNNQVIVCTCKHRWGHEEQHEREHYEHEHEHGDGRDDEYKEEQEEHEHEHEHESKGWKQSYNDEGDSSDHDDSPEEPPLKSSTIPKSGGPPSSSSKPPGLNHTMLLPSPGSAANGTANEGMSASTAPPSSHMLPLSEKPTGQGNGTDPIGGSNTNSANGTHAADAPSPGGNKMLSPSGNEPPLSQASDSSDLMGGSSLKSPVQGLLGDNAGAPHDAPSPSGKNPLVNDKLSPSDIPASGQGSNDTSLKAPTSGGNSNPSFNTSAGALPPPTNTSSAGTIPRDSGSG